MELLFLVGSASLPFVAKITVMLLGFQGYVLQSLYKVIQLLVPVSWRFSQGKKGLLTLWPIDEPLPSWRMLGIATLIAIGLSGAGIAALNFLLPFWQIEPHVIRSGFDERFSVGPIAAVPVAIFLSFVNSALEELHFRAWLDQELSRRIGNIAGISCSAITFASMHGLIFLGLPGFPISLITTAVFGLFICGICWSLLMRQSGGIHAAWWSHGLTDALLLGWGLHWLGYV